MKRRSSLALLALALLAAVPLVLAVLAGRGAEPWSRLLAGHRRPPGDRQRFPPLAWAAREGRVGAIEALLAAGADPDERDRGPNGWAPLHHAVHKNQLGAVRALLARGADAGARSDNGTTPLILAAGQGELDILQELLAAGADPRAANDHGATALVEAVARGDAVAVRVLLERDPGLALEDGILGWSAPLLARLQGRGEVLDLLRERGGER